MRIEYEDCLNEGLLIPATPSLEKALICLKKAKHFLKIAEMNYEQDAFDGSVIMAYLSMFSSAKAILARDGFREKSHVCVSRYIEKQYVPGRLDRRYVVLLDRYRNLRHDDQYDVSFYAGRDDARSMISFARELMAKIERIING